MERNKRWRGGGGAGEQAQKDPPPPQHGRNGLRAPDISSGAPYRLVCFPQVNEGFTCYEVLGFDILLDHNYRPWLLEVNHSPSLNTDTPLDYRIKKALLTEVMDLLQVGPNPFRTAARRHGEQTGRRADGQADRQTDR